MNAGTGHLTTRLIESPAKTRRHTGLSKTAWLKHAFVMHLRDIARTYLALMNKPLIVTIDNVQ